MIEFSPAVIYFLSALTGLAIALFSIPQVNYVAKRKRLLDLPDNHRKLHVRVVSNLGGVGIIIAFLISASLMASKSGYASWGYLAASALILFTTGLKDDLVNISPSKKFLAQALAAVVMVVCADVRLESLHGILGFDTLPYWASIVVSVIGITFVTNAFNLIDGIDGLAGSISLLASSVLGVALAVEGRIGEAAVAFSLAGGVAGFLRYNWAPARIFMGDTGALVIGFTLSVLAISVANGGGETAAASNAFLPSASGAMLLALCALFVPIFDTFRVFTTRIVKGSSPFRADRTHLHHYLLDLGFNHSSTVVILVVSNLLIMMLGYLVQGLNIHAGLAILFGTAGALVAALWAMRKKHLAQHHTPVDSAATAHWRTRWLTTYKLPTGFGAAAKRRAALRRGEGVEA